MLDVKLVIRADKGQHQWTFLAEIIALAMTEKRDATAIHNEREYNISRDKIIARILRQHEPSEGAFDALREKLAAYAHDESWAHWMKYLFSKCARGDDNSLVIPGELADRWMRQAKTSYDDLPEEEKKSDREQADKILKIVAENS
jgi:hypothetical protein